ncbi:hypothetical protein GSI_08660 [Ganoderma sinense ZZ0214-1]|uniref:BTB domain-containing protein n=1 Tax=Ganoderma sinense ZZ0214-1 TaxID=1077348 RepID=A0A2G8S4X7_9APHY|nr:hypothetical protein GSI_08660 [Ganoderma sinense ZZ0214-1]
MDPNAIIERHPKFYFPSGDIVLATKLAPQADDSEGPPRYQVFRVHKFLLALRSTVFSNLFADADGAASNELSYDGVPLVELHGDNTQDFALLLSYLYEPESSLAFRHHDPNTPITVSGVVRLADKYLLEPLRKRLISEVVQDWPTTLREWDIQQANIHAISAVTTLRDAPYLDRGPPLCDVIPEPASAIVFAQEFVCPEILPAAFYRLLQIPFDDDWSLRVHSAPYSSQSLARWSLLDRDNLARYIHGLHAVESYIPDSRNFVFMECIPKMWEGEPDSPCYEYVRYMFSVLGRRRGGQAGRDPLRWLADCEDHYGISELSEKYPKGLCEDCCAAVALQVPVERQRVWRELLPKWFQLE